MRSSMCCAPSVDRPNASFLDDHRRNLIEARLQSWISTSAGAERRLISLNLGQYQTTAGETFGRPIRFSLVVFRDGWNVRRKLNPRLLGGSKDVYIGRQVIWRIERAYPNKPDNRARPRIIAPYGEPAFGAARDLLSLSAVRWRVDDLRFPTQMHHVIGLDHGV